MKIHVVQREGTRYFSRFTNLAERDRLQVELQIEDKNGQTVSIDLTEALIEEYSKHPQIGKVSIPSQVVEITLLEPIKSLKTKRSKTVSPAYLADSPHADILSKVREAQVKAADEKRQKQAELAAARAERLAIAREAKAQKLKAESGKPKATSTKTNATPTKAAKVAPAKPPKPAAKVKTTQATAAKAAEITKTQEQAIKKIGKVLAKEEKGQLALVTPPRKTASKASAKASASTSKLAKAASAAKPAARKSNTLHVPPTSAKRRIAPHSKGAARS